MLPRWHDTKRTRVFGKSHRQISTLRDWNIQDRNSQSPRGRRHYPTMLSSHWSIWWLLDRAIALCCQAFTTRLCQELSHREPSRQQSHFGNATRQSTDGPENVRYWRMALRDVVMVARQRWKKEHEQSVFVPLLPDQMVPLTKPVSTKVIISLLPWPHPPNWFLQQKNETSSCGRCTFEKDRRSIHWLATTIYSSAVKVFDNGLLWV